MKKVLFVVCLFVLANLGATAAPVDPQSAARVAKNAYWEQIRQHRDIDFNAIHPELVYTEAGQSVIYYYVFNLNTGGFIIVTADDAVAPVLGFSFDGSYSSENQPPAFIRWMNDYKEQIRIIKEKGYVADAGLKAEWQRLGSSVQVPLRDIKTLLPLLHTKWDQGKFYNEYCPYDPAGPGDHAYAGCVPTAMGQIVNYYRWPVQGTGSYTYVHPDYDTISADFGNTMYRWNEMPVSLTTYNSAVAELLFHLGASVDLDYGATGSGMFNHKAAYSLRTYFGYSPQTEYVFRDTCHLYWKGMVLTHLDNNMPLYYAGWADTINVDGHAFVCDGYQDTNYFHMNWGWSGSLDGYFMLDNLTPGGMDFTLDHELIINIFPDGAYPGHCAGTDTLTTLQGNINDGSGPLNEYAANADCYWLISPVDSAVSIKLTFLEFDLVGPDDMLIVYNGDEVTDPVLDTLSGNSLPTQLIATGPHMLLHFISDDSLAATGFLAQYTTTVPVFCSGIQTLTSPSGSIEDGSGTFNYHNNNICRWKIQPAGATAITIHFNSMNLGAGDLFKITDQLGGQTYALFTGDTAPADIVCPSGKLLILFQTDSYFTGQGWDLNYFESTGLTEYSELSELEVIPNPAKEYVCLTGTLVRSQLLNVELLNSTLQCVFKKQFHADAGTLNLRVRTGLFAPGLYLMRISGDNAVTTRKIVITE